MLCSAVAPPSSRGKLSGRMPVGLRTGATRRSQGGELPGAVPSAFADLRAIFRFGGFYDFKILLNIDVPGGQLSMIMLPD